LVFDYAKFRIRPWCGISALIEEERVWRGPPSRTVQVLALGLAGHKGVLSKEFIVSFFGSCLCFSNFR
jgi:hypothetical protein